MIGIWFCFHYKGNNFDYQVHDVDQLQLLDIIRDLGTVALKQSVLIPDVYDLYYKVGLGNVKRYIRNDDHLLDMVKGCDLGETLDIYLEDTKTPLQMFEYARDLNRQAELRRLAEEERLRKAREEEAERQRVEAEMGGLEPLSVEIPVVDVDTQEQIFVRVYGEEFPESQDVGFDAPTDNTQADGDGGNVGTSGAKMYTPIYEDNIPSESEEDIPYESEDDIPCESEDDIPTNSMSPSNNDQPDLSQPPKQSTPASKKFTAPRRPYNPGRSQVTGGKVPKTTAKRMGTFVPKVRRNNNQEGASDEVRTGRSGVRRSIIDELSDDEFNSDSEDSDFHYSSHSNSSEGEEDEWSDSSDLNIETEDVLKHPFEQVVQVDAETGDDVNAADNAYRNGKMYVEQPYGEITLQPWLIFKHREAFMEVFSNFVIQSGFVVVIIKSECKRYTAECKHEECTWRIHSSIMPDKVSWQIRTIQGTQRCLRVWENPMATFKWLCEKLLDDVRANPAIPGKSLREICKNRFKAMFMTFASWIKGFLNGCRPIIGVDGTHLKGTYKGILLSAISVDANNNLFLIAYAIVSKENKANWLYFFRNLRSAFQQQECCQWDWTFISDRMKGVEPALNKEFPGCTIRVCAQHLYENWRKSWGSPAYYEVFWTAAKATSVCEYRKAVDEMSEMDPQAALWLDEMSEMSVGFFW